MQDYGQLFAIKLIEFEIKIAHSSRRVLFPMPLLKTNARHTQKSNKYSNKLFAFE